MGYAFISYSSKNQEAADAMRNLFRKHSIDSWMAPYDIPAGSEYAEVLYDALVNCSCLVLMLTDVSQNSQWVKKEVNIAISNGKAVIPVKLEDVELNSSMKLYLNDQQIVPVRVVEESAPDMQKVLTSVLAHTGRSASAEPRKASKETKTHDTCDVFLSYRRSGSDFAGFLTDELVARGMNVYYDMDCMTSGDFLQQIKKAIDEAVAVIVILTPNALDRCISDPNDWIAQELNYAIQQEKWIIPVIMGDFTFPKGLPYPLSLVEKFNTFTLRMDRGFRPTIQRIVEAIERLTQPRMEPVVFDMRQVRTFASCGKEDTVFKVRKSADGEAVSISANFERTRLRDEIPAYAGVYYLRCPALDVSDGKKIVFRAASDDASIETMWVEIKPEGKAWMHETFEIELGTTMDEYVIDFADFEHPEVTGCLEEITFVLKPTSFRDENDLTGKLEIAQLRIC